MFYEGFEVRGERYMGACHVTVRARRHHPGGLAKWDQLVSSCVLTREVGDPIDELWILLELVGRLLCDVRNAEQTKPDGSGSVGSARYGGKASLDPLEDILF